MVATDFSPCSEAILPYARSLALQYDSTLFFTHVIPTDVLNVDVASIEAPEASARRLMDELEVTQQLAGIRQKRLVEEGEPATVLSRMIKDQHIDLIIVGTHGRTGLNRLVMGSVAEELFRHAPCPVLTVGPKVWTAPKRDGKIAHVLFATDLHPENAGPIAHAVSLAHQNKAHLTLLHVAEVDSLVPVPQKLLDLVPEEMELWCEPEALVEIGDAAQRILEVAANRHADVIVMGAHRPGMLTTHFMDVAYKVVCEAPCPVLTVGPAFHK
jgi:nucleotide-binding universal stress UspA family protein